MFSALTISDTILVAFQFLLLQAAALSLNFTLYYFYSPTKIIKIFLLIAVFFNPLFFDIANTISSDNIYLSLSLIWFTLLLWIIYQPTANVIYWHSVVLFLAFVVRFNAMFFPFVSIWAFYVSKASIKLKIRGLVLSLLLISIFVVYNREKYYELSGVRELAPFSGWQMASNGLFAYKHVSANLRKDVPLKFNNLDKQVRLYLDNSFKSPDYAEPRVILDRFMWSQDSPLWVYYWQNFADKDDINNPNVWGKQPFRIKNWAKVAPLYKEYGAWLILHYPKEFFQYVILLNVKSWFIPPMVQLQYYNCGYTDIAENIVDWFKYKTHKISTRFTNIGTIDEIYGLYPLFTGYINAVFLILFALFIRRIKNDMYFIYNGLILVAVFWLINFSFNVFASPIELRYVLFPIHIITVNSIIMVGRLSDVFSNGQPKNIQ
jgi:hypothetical protein